MDNTISFINNNKDKIKRKNIEYSKDSPNPIFKKKQSIINEQYNNNIFEIYQLKDINNAFFIIFPTFKKNDLSIYIFYYSTKNYEKMVSLSSKEFGLLFIEIKYFYDPINNKEYLYILNNGILYIYLIYNESKYELIKIINDISNNNYDSYYIKYFEIIHNKFDNNNYLIIISTFSIKNCFSLEERRVEIVEIKNKSYNLIKLFILKNDDFDFFRMDNLIYKDNYNKQIFILVNDENSIKKIEIKNNYNNYNKDFQNLIDSNEDLNNFKKFIHEANYNNSCIVYDNDKDYLYISSYEGNIIIIDLIKRQLIEKINLNINVNYFINWNFQYFLLISEQFFFIYDKNINKIISKYLNIFEDKKNKYCIKTHFSKKDNFYCLFIGEKGNINYLLIKDNFKI